MNQKAKTYAGYLRVSTTKQGELGVSLPEQRDIISRYADRKGLVISTWFEERVTAAKQGRPLYTNMLRLLADRKVAGAIIHKIDRSARNLRDWVDLTDLLEAGLDICIAADDLDLKSRGGRLAADIQAVVASDYSRNLRDEAKKGLYGRLKQGVYPFAAPPGYTNTGAGNPKAVDPIMGPLVRTAFQLYATGEYPIRILRDEMARRGLKNSVGTALGVNCMNKLLRNPFYYGVLHVKRTNLSFLGKHEPLISKELFLRVQHLLDGKSAFRTTRHSYSFRRLLACARCGYSLVGERQKGHVYYRCHTLSCPVTCVREEAVEEQVEKLLTGAKLKEPLVRQVESALEKLRHKEAGAADEARRVLRLRIADAHARRQRVEEAYFDGTIDKSAFTSRTTAVDDEVKGLEASERDLATGGGRFAQQVEQNLELISTALLQWKIGNEAERRSLLKMITSNRRVSLQNVELEPRKEFSMFFDRSGVPNGGDGRDAPRTPEDILNEMIRIMQVEGMHNDEPEKAKPDPRFRWDRS